MSESYAEILTVGGKSNSLGRSSELIELVLRDKNKLDELYGCLFNDNAWVRMRAIDAMEKICRQQSDWLLPYINRFQSELVSNKQPSIQWHLAQIYSQVDLTLQQKHDAISWLKDILATTEIDWIVAASAMKTLVQFTKDGSVSKKDTISLLKIQQKHASKSVTKKANQLLTELSSKIVEQTITIGFKDTDEFYDWLSDNYSLQEGVWIKMAKKDSGIASIDTNGAVDVGLCWGWISSHRKGLDETYYLQKYTPRRPKSNWSKVNVEKVQQLERTGKIQSPGQKEIDEAKADGRWMANIS